MLMLKYLKLPKPYFSIAFKTWHILSCCFEWWNCEYFLLLFLYIFVLSNTLTGKGKQSNYGTKSISANQIKPFGLSYSRPVFCCCCFVFWFVCFNYESQSEIVSATSTIWSCGLMVEGILYSGEDSWHLLNNCYKPNRNWSSLYILSYLILTSTWWGSTIISILLILKLKHKS